MNCHNCQSVLPDLLLDPAAPIDARVQEHLDSCSACRQELASLRSTFALLDSWEAPEPSPYFDQKLAARLREEKAAAPAGWLERLQSYLLLNTGRQFRPAMAGALALVLLVGGGAAIDVAGIYPHHNSISATVNDLQIFDKNEQAMQTMDQLLEDNTQDDSNSGLPSS